MNIDRRLLEPDIKAMILNHLIDKNKLNPNHTIINEFTVDGYSRRVDLLIADKKHLTAFEVKSEADSLNRLEGQTQKYLEYFDKVVIVAAHKHIDKILASVPQNVEVWEIHENRLKIKQRGKLIPTVNKAKFIDLMKANELLKLANKLNLSPKSKNRRSLINDLQNAPLKTLREATLQYIGERFNLTNSLFWKQVRTGTISPKHIELLSPYKEERQYQITQEIVKKSLWKSLSSSLGEDPHLMAMSQKRSQKIFGTPPKHIQLLLAA